MKLTRSQFASVVRDTEKGVENAARILGRRLGYSPDEARWLGVVRLLTQHFELPLARAATLADEILRHSIDERSVAVRPSNDDAVALVFDLARYHSTFAALLSAAINHGGPRRRGRPSRQPRPKGRKAIESAETHGVDLSLVRRSLERTPAERLAQLDANATFLRGLRPV